MADKTYMVQCWDDAGALVNNYETLIGTPTELKELKKFLSGKHSHVLITPVPPKRRGAK